MNPPNKPVRFVIVGTQRTGTTLIRTSLSSHPEILCHGEVFKLGKPPYSLVGGYWEYSRRSFSKKIRSLVARRAFTASYLEQMYDDTGYRAIGFKFMLNQCKSRPEVWPLLTALGVKSILVSRRNVLKTLVSRRTAEASGVYHVSKSLPTARAVDAWVAKSIQVETETLIDDLEAIESESAEWRMRLKGGVEYIEIVYEDYLDDIGGSNRNILSFLQVPELDLQSDLKKVNPEELGRLISNLDDVASTLKGTRFSFCLDAS